MFRIVTSLSICKLIHLEGAPRSFPVHGRTAGLGWLVNIRAEGRDRAFAALRPSQGDGGFCVVHIRSAGLEGTGLAVKKCTELTNWWLLEELYQVVCDFFASQGHQALSASLAR